MNKILSNVNVLDFTHTVAGPFASMLLADLGANVIKVEPLNGDEVRGAAPIVNGMSIIFASSNRNKKSIAIDLKNKQSKEILNRLFSWANVVLENYRPGVREELGVSPQDAFKINKNLIYVSIKGFRPGSKYGNLPAYDMVVQGMSGIMLSLGNEGDPPLKVPFALFDIFTGYLASLEVLVGLYSGIRPYYAESYLFDTGIYSMNYLVQSYLATKKNPPRTGGSHFSYAPHQAYKASDGKYFIVAIVNDRQWIKLCEVLKLDDLKDDKSLLSNAERVKNKDRINERLQKIFLTQDRDHWVKLLRDSGIPCAPVYSLSDLFSDEYTSELTEKIEGINFPLISFPGYINNEKIKIRKAPPSKPGLDSNEVLKELGFNEKEIEKFKEENIII